MELDSFLYDYLGSCQERLQRLEAILLEIEKCEISKPKDLESKECFRDLYSHLHSLKGTSGSYGLNAMMVVAHQFEDSLEQFLASNNSSAPTDTWLDYLDNLNFLIGEYLKERKDEDLLKEIQRKLPDSKKDKLKVLIVEDTNIIYKQYQRLGQELHIGISRSENGLEAFKRLMREPFDVLITAGNTGLLDGKSLISAIKSTSGLNRKIKTILTTSKDQSEFEDFIVKPDQELLKTPKLLDELKKILQKILKKDFLIFKENLNVAQKDSETLKKVYYIDDDSDLHFLVKSGLEQLGDVEFKMTEDPKLSQAIASEFKPDLILLDYMMPDQDGPQTFKALRKAGVNCPVIFLTARTKEEELNELKNLGAQGVIPKPFLPKSLPETIEKVWGEITKT